MVWPNTLSAMDLFRLVRSQTEKLPRRRWSHSPQMIVNGTTTRSPTFKPFVLGADLDDLAHELVAHDVARLHPGHQAVVEMRVGAADHGAADLDDQHRAFMRGPPIGRGRRGPPGRRPFSRELAAPGFVPDRPMRVSCQCAFSLAAKNWHQPCGVIGPWTILQLEGGWNCRQISQRCWPLGWF